MALAEKYLGYRDDDEVALGSRIRLGEGDEGLMHSVHFASKAARMPTYSLTARAEVENIARFSQVKQSDTGIEDRSRSRIDLLHSVTVGAFLRNVLDPILRFRRFEAIVWAIVALTALVNLLTGALSPSFPISSLVVLLAAFPLSVYRFRRPAA